MSEEIERRFDSIEAAIKDLSHKIDQNEKRSVEDRILDSRIKYIYDTTHNTYLELIRLRSAQSDLKSTFLERRLEIMS